MTKSFGWMLLCGAAAACSSSVGSEGEGVGSQAQALTFASGAVPRLFDGTDDRAVVPYNAAYDFGTGDFTLAVTAKVSNSSDTTVVPLISKRVAAYPYDGFYFVVYGNSLLLQIRGNNALSAVSSKNLRDGAYHHFAVRRQAGVLTFFVDGVAAGTANNGGNVSSSVGLTFGYDALDNHGVRGNIGNVGMWNGALSDAEVQSASTGAKLLDTRSVGYWDLTLVSKELILDESPIKNQGSLGDTLGSWDDKEASPQLVEQVVGASSGSMSTARLTATQGGGSGTVSGASGAADQCSDILIDGTHDTFLSSSATNFASATQTAFCNSFSELTSNSGTMNIGIPIKGIKIGLSSSTQHTKDIHKEYCEANATQMDYATAYDVATQIASPVIVNAWLDCMKLKQTVDIVTGSSTISPDGHVLTLTATNHILMQPQPDTIVWDFTVIGAQCPNQFQNGDQILVTGNTITCTRSGHGSVTAVLNTNHGPVIWNFGPVSTAQAWVTGNTQEWAALTRRCQAFSTSKYNCSSGLHIGGTCIESHGRTYDQNNGGVYWDVASNQRATNAAVTVNGSTSETKVYGQYPGAGVYDTHVYGALRVYKQQVVSFNLCADVEQLTPTAYTTDKADVDTSESFVVEVPVKVQSPVLHLLYTDGSQKLVNLTTPGTTATVSAMSDGISNSYEVTMPTL